jgi:hypothetical protein
MITKHVSTNEQVVDLVTMPISKVALIKFQNKLCLQPKHNLRESVNNAQSNDNNRVDGVIKDIQDYGRNKDEHSLTTTINISYIIGDMLGEKEV